MPTDKRLTRSSFSGHIQPISTRRLMPLLPRRIWSDSDWQRIQLGYRAPSMDQKWDVFTEDNVAFLHRSWTGFGIFEATFSPVDGGGRQITEGVVERDPERYRGQDDEYDCLIMELVLSAVVLGEPAEDLRATFREFVRQGRGR
ncbi:hypothetical protein ACIHFE_30080 [Streptomyces sp. NPDC052396]|uniref:hypothetical protein n=1 Tax=Streptomyces sp. NPDC052396 TaxID=3365689 RepID=UPI0037D45B24